MSENEPCIEERFGINTRLSAPVGKFRVIGVDLFSHEDYLIADCSSQEEAFKIVDEKNAQRENTMSDVWYVYDDKGKFLRGDEVSGLKDPVTGENVSP